MRKPMRSPYRWFGCAFCLLLIAAVPAQLFVRKGFNDPATNVDQMMGAMPRSLNLTSGQRKQMRRIYIDQAAQEQRLYFQPGSSFVKRGEARRLDDQVQRKLQAILSH